MDKIKTGFDQGVFAARQFGAEFIANPGSSRMDYLNDAAFYFGEGKTYSKLTPDERKALNKAFTEGEQAERLAR